MIYDDWIQAKSELTKAKKKELELRELINKEFLSQKLEGAVTNRTEGYKVVSTAKLNRKLDEAMLGAIYADLSDKEKKCVVFKPSLVLAKYRQIENDGGKLTEAVEVKPGQSSLDITLEEI